MTATRYFEDMEDGEVTHLGSYEFTAGNIRAFARKYDPQPFHLDEEAARRSHFERLCASGWHTCCAFMKTHAEYHLGIIAGTTLAPGERWPEPGPATGFRDLRWIRPVHAGDTVAFSQRVLARRPLASRPRWGLVTSRIEGVNQNGEPVLAFTNFVFHERRTPG